MVPARRETGTDFHARTPQIRADGSPLGPMAPRRALNAAAADTRARSTPKLLLIHSPIARKRGFLADTNYSASAPGPKDRHILKVIGGEVEDTAMRTSTSNLSTPFRFSGFLRDKTAEQQRGRLEAWLKARGMEHEDEWRVAGYNPPWTIPQLRRNEVLVTLR